MDTNYINLVIAMATSVAAFSTGVAAFFAWRATSVSKIASQGSNFRSLFEEYSEKKMAENLRQLRIWRENFKTVAEFTSKWHESLLNENAPLHNDAKSVHNARRYVLYYFIKCWYMWKTGSISELMLKKLINPETAEIFVKVTVPLTNTWGPASRFKSDMLEIAKYVGLNDYDPITNPCANIKPEKTDL